MQTQIIIILSLVTVALGIYNGQMIRWGHSVTPSVKTYWSAAWHRTGFIIRFLIAVVVLLSGGWGWFLVVAFLSYPVYNAIISIYLSQGIFYIGSTAWMDKNIPHWIHYSLYILMAISGVVLIAVGH